MEGPYGTIQYIECDAEVPLSDNEPDGWNFLGAGLLLLTM